MAGILIWVAKNWRLTLFLAVTGCLCLAVGWGLWQRERLTSLKNERDDLAATVEGYKEAAKIRRSDDLRRSEISTAADQFEQDMAKQEGGDAPLDSYLSTGARKLWP